MTALDATIVNIALPSAQAALGFGDGARQWVVTAYTLSFAGLLLLGGGWRMSSVGAARSSSAPAASRSRRWSRVAPPDLPVLVAGRALQGAFAALIAPTALSLLAVTFTETKERAKAFARVRRGREQRGAAGLLLGGVLTEYFDWRWCLFVNVVVAVGVMAVGRVVLPDPPRFGSARIDVVSAGFATGGLAMIVLGCSQAAAHGWSSAFVLGALAIGVVFVIAFVRRQSRMDAPLLPLRILADRNRAGAYVGAAAAVVGAFGMFLMLTYYLQLVLGYSPVQAGLAVLPLTVANSIGGYQLGTRLAPLVAPRVLIAGGLAITAAGLTVLSTMDVHSGFAATVLPAEILVGHRGWAPCSRPPSRWRSAASPSATPALRPR